MTETVKPERITKPIQLLGAWLAGLLAINTCFLVSASQMPLGSWEMRALVVAAIVNVPLFLLAVFLLQTKFRPEMQEDSYYATYLSSKTNERIVMTKDDTKIALVAHRIAEVESRLTTPKNIQTLEDTSSMSTLKIGINKFLKDIDEIGTHLGLFGVKDYIEFGGIDPPDQRAVAISHYLPTNIRASILRVAYDVGFKYYTLFDNIEEESEEEVLFGCYGGKLRNIVRSV